MNNFKFSKRSENNLKGVHPDLVKVVRLALRLSDIDFTVIEGVRTQERQKQLYQQKVTRTMNSRHLTGHAVDIIPYPVNWNNWDQFKQVAKAMKQAAKQLKISLVWGGEWESFKDGPHFELSKKRYA